MEKLGKIDVLVNNSGIIKKAPLVDMSEEDWDEVMNTNLRGVFLCLQAAARHMIEQKSGKIINIASIGGLRANLLGAGCYGASKAGVIQLTRFAALELGPSGINVNCIAPGPVETPLQIEGRTPEQLEEWRERSRDRESWVESLPPRM